MTDIKHRIMHNLDHAQVSIRQEFYVDEDMENILNELWRCEVLTEYSCQGDVFQRKNAYILFPKMSEGLWFARFLAEQGFKSNLSRREFIYGGGVSVDFCALVIPSLVLKLKKLNWQTISLSILQNEQDYEIMAAQVPPFGEILAWPQ